MRLAGIAALLAMLAALGGCNNADGGLLGKSALKSPQTFTVDTADGWTLSVLRYAPNQPDPQRLPVVLCHGLSYNGQFWDLADAVSLATYLQQAGYDVWVPSLRGAGWSTKPPLSRLRQLFRGDLLTAGGVFTSAGKGLLKVNWTVDDHVQFDVPAILDLVTRQSGRDKLHWIGHSMGGMILVGHLAGHADEPRLASFVAMGVPVFIEQPVSKPMAMLSGGRTGFEISNAIVSTNLPALWGQIAGKALPTPIDVLFYNRANTADDTVRRLNAWGTEEISPGQLAQLIDMIQTGRFASTDGKTDYTAALGKCACPALFVCGTVDNLATPGAVRQLHNAWGGRKDFALFGVVNGQQTDYGHDDLVIGQNARQDVYPVVRAWLDSFSPAKSLLPGLNLPAKTTTPAR